MIIKIGMQGAFVEAWQEFLTANGYADLISIFDGIFGINTQKATIRFQVDNGLDIDGIVGPETIEKAKEFGFKLPEPDMVSGITLEQFNYIMRETKSHVLEEHLPYCNDTMLKYEINNKLRIQHFLAQVGHESVGLKYMAEIASGQAYEGRRDLGNIYAGDGRKFKGHGPIQITGRANHIAYFNFIGRPDLIDDPEILETNLELCWGASGWFWKSRGLNEIADSDDDSMSIFRGQNKTLCKITRIVNGWYNGLTDRAWYLKRAKEVII
jgi:putative chitinase